jgi:hypothetical protein
MLVAVIALACASASAAKEFGPGDLRLCNTRSCVTVNDRPLLRALSSFIYTGPQPTRATAPRRGAAAFELRFSNAYVAGVIGTAKLDRFYSYGVYCGRFLAGHWYRIPANVARHLRRLTAGLSPLRLKGSRPRSC